MDKASRLIATIEIRINKMENEYGRYYNLLPVCHL